MPLCSSHVRWYGDAFEMCADVCLRAGGALSTVARACYADADTDDRILLRCSAVERESVCVCVRAKCEQAQDLRLPPATG